MINYKIIQSLGLNKKESEVYLACLSLGSVSIGEMSKNTGIQRTHLYDLTKKLIANGFILQTSSSKKKKFLAVSPRKIFKKKQKELEKIEKDILELEKLTKKIGRRPKIVYYEGKSEIDSMTSSAFGRKDELFVFTDELFYTRENKEYQQKNIQRRINSKSVCRSLSAMTNLGLEAKKEDKKKMRETRLLPKDIFEPKVMLGTYNNNTYVINHQKNFAFVVEDEDLADTLKMIFNLTWKSGKVLG